MLVIPLSFVFFLFFYVRFFRQIPGKIQNILEALIEFIDEQILGTVGLPIVWRPLLLSLFLFILINNYSGLIPGVRSATSQVTVTGTLAGLVFICVQVIGIRQKGNRYVRSFIPEGVRGLMVFFIFPMEVISHCLRPFSLAIRLFANMTAGHLLTLTFLGFITLYRSLVVIPFSLLSVLLVSLFEVFVGAIQAYIFTFLTSLYIKEAISEDH
jgi:F-type H+-transporting ATPase subunit a